MTSGVERRRARRFAAHIPVRRPYVTSNSVFGVTKDISSAGVYFYTESIDWQAGKRIEFVLELPEDVTLTEAATSLCRGTVLRTEQVESVVGVAVRIDRFSFLQ